MSNDEHILEYSGALHLTRKIAVGGMATVYEAELDAPRSTVALPPRPLAVALKVMKSGIGSRTALLRFEHEAELRAFAGLE